MKIIKFLFVSALFLQSLPLAASAQGKNSSAVSEISGVQTGAYANFDLVSRSYDTKTFGTFWGSVTPAIGGIDDVGVVEGQFVAYMTSWNVDPKHGGKYRQIIWFNRGNGRTALVSRSLDDTGGDKDSYEPVIDVTGYNVAFESHATNLAAGDNNKASDIFLWRLVPSVEVSCITCGGNFGSIEPSVSHRADHVAFTSYSNNLTPGVDGSTTANVYVKNAWTGETTLVSKDSKTGKGIGGRHPSISEDGSRIAFYSYADKLADGDNNKLWDIFVWERGNPKLKRISLTAAGRERDQGSESASRIVKPTISGDGRYVAFATTATNMTGGAPTKPQHVYVVEIDTGRVIRASETAAGAPGDADSPVEQGERIALSYDGTWVSFTTKATNLGGKIIVKNIRTGEVMPIPVGGHGGAGTPALSRSGKCIAFPSSEKFDKRYDSSGIFAACR